MAVGDTGTLCAVGPRGCRLLYTQRARSSRKPSPPVIDAFRIIVSAANKTDRHDGEDDDGS